ncbi:helix-turn-helix transcriptional regulator [Herbaspirillum seropedicae]|uniref:helix-turn-helix transcriptional regulator n=1 Tax=Herbaspirillum seropedicae TaxID=964 RepID=UPI00111DF69D|nr:helix-turn-helix transcriptional regulator [Herbaspirillum seropedicae]QDD65539.1 helix-turn-helix transcriptional regulator [Herbaspirillum seropedicae]
MKKSSKEQRFDQLIELIYGSVEDIDQLGPAMQLMCSEIGAVAGHYIHMDVPTREVFNSVISDPAYTAGDAEYRDYYSRIDDRLQWVATGMTGEWRADHQRFDERFVRRSEIYNDFLFKYGVRHQIVSRIGGEAWESEGVSFLRPLGAAEYGDDVREFLARVTRHLIRSSALRRSLRALNRQKESDDTLLQHLPYGTVLVDTHGRVVLFNKVASDILTIADGVYIKSQRLSASDAGADRMLSAAIAQATSPVSRRGEWFTVPRQRHSQPLIVSVIPTLMGQTVDISKGEEALALIILQDIARQRLPRGAILQKIYKLTPAETRLAEALLDNQTIESYSVLAGISRNTVRTHLANLFAKTGTRRQAELLRILIISGSQVADYWAGF